MYKDYYTMEEIDEIENELIERVGENQLLNALLKWLSYDTKRDFYNDVCRLYDITIDDEEEEDEEDDL